MNPKSIISHIIVFILGMLTMLLIGGIASYNSPFIVYDTLKYVKNTIHPKVSDIEKFKQATTEEKRFYTLGPAAKEAFTKGDYATAKSYAEKLEKLTPKYKTNWNYGNAIQDYNIVLGLIALKNNQNEEAKKHLIAAGKSPGSPQMNSFGPNMMLAKALLEAGEKETVIEYFKLCKTFWRMDRGRLDEWIILVKAGRIPRFGTNLVY